MNKVQTTQIASQAATVLITIVISMTGFWMMIGREFVTREEVSKMTETRLELVRDNMNDFEKIAEAIVNKIGLNMGYYRDETVLAVIAILETHSYA